MEFIKDFFETVYDVRSLVVWAGYFGLFVIIFAETGLLIGFFLPGDSLLVTAGLFCATNVLNIVYLNLLLIPAAILGNTIGYFIGYKSGPKLFRREQSLLFRKDYLIKTKLFYETHGPSTIILTRFIPFLRTFSPIVAGVGQMKYSKFFYYNILSAVLWVLSMTLVGYYLGRFIPNIDKHIEWVIAGVIFVSILPGIIKILKNRYSKKVLPDC